MGSLKEPIMRNVEKICMDGSTNNKEYWRDVAIDWPDKLQTNSLCDIALVYCRVVFAFQSA